VPGRVAPGLVWLVRLALLRCCTARGPFQCVLKMKHPKASDPATGGTVEDRARILYNEWIIIENIPDRPTATSLVPARPSGA
jgi:hypothetical protein